MAFERDLLLPFYSDNTFVKKISGSPLVELRIGKGAIIAGEMMIEAPLDPICRSENAPKAMYRSYSSTPTRHPGMATPYCAEAIC